MKKKKIKIIKLKRKKFAILISLVLIAAVIVFLQKPETERLLVAKCFTSFDCGWKSTNCCPESAGARWRCVNLKNFTAECPPLVLCPQVISPKPSLNCVCQQGGCVTK